MKFKSSLKSILIAMCLALLMPAISFADATNPYQLYQQVISGKTKLDSLTLEQQRQVLGIHTALSRSSCDGCSDDCRDAREQAESYRSDLEGYTKRLYRCIESNDLTDDCYSEFRRVKSYHNDFESAVSNVSSYCD